MTAGYSPSGAANPASPHSPAGKLALNLQNGHSQQMDGRQPDYQPPEHPPATPYQQGQDPRASANFSSSATPTSEYGIAPSSARSGTFPEYIQRPQYTPTGQGPPTGGMAQQPSPSLSLQNHQANSHASHDMKPNNDVPIDPSIAASPTYPAQPPYSPYQPHPDMAHYASTPGVYGRPEWAAQGQYPGAQPPMGHYGHPVSSGPPSAGLVSPGGHPLSTVYSFVPIPGAQQHKRPRRRYEEIERMYKCGWNGCEKAYGTLNHLNAHVTMQSHGQKRTPEEFKEIRKEWKQKKKEEEQARKADDERHRQQADSRAPEGPPMGGPHLPPIGYAPQGSGPTQAGANNSYPNSPYPPHHQMYQQR